MSDARFTIDLDGNVFKAFEQIKKDTSSLKTSVTSIETASSKSFTSLQNHVRNISFVNITQGLQNVTTALNDIAGPGIKFDSAMADLSAITGQTGQELDNLGKLARENAKIFGGDASKSVNTFKLLLSQLGPELAKTPEVLNMMAQNTERLAKTMGGDVVGAAEVITTSMNQYNVDLTDAAAANKVMNRMMNQMAASAKEGSSELPTLQAAIKNVGGDANRANIPFEQMLSSIQLLDKAGKKGAEGGIALRNVISTLNQGRFLPKDVQDELNAAGVDIDALSDKSLSFTDRLRNLQGVSEDAALMSKLFGRENQGAAQALINSIDKQEQMTAVIADTNTANEQAEVIMQTAAEKQARLNAQIDDFKVSLFNATGGAFAYLAPISDMARQLSAFGPLINGAAGAFKYLSKTKLAGAIATKAVTAATWLWNVAMNANPIFLIISGVAALGAGIYGLTKLIGGQTSAQKAANAVSEKAADLAAEETAEANILFEQLRRTTKGTKERSKVIDELNAKFPKLLKNYDLERASNEEIAAAQKEVIAGIKQRAEAEAAMDLYKESFKEYLKEQAEGPGAMDQLLGFMTPGLSAEQFQAIDNVQNKKEADEFFKLYLNKRKALDKDSAEDIAEQSAIEDSKGVEPSSSSPIEPAEESPALIPDRDKVIQGTGGEMKNINVRIENLVKSININTSNLRESGAEIKRQITETLVGAVRDFELSM